MTGAAPPANPATRPDLALAALLRLSCAYAIATNGTILMPLIVGALMRRYGVGEDAATGVGALEIAGIAISCALFPRWIAHAPRRLAWLATLGTLAAQAASAWMPGLAALGAARLATGLFEGVLFVVVAASLANRPAAERAWGVIILVSGLIDCALLVAAYALPEATIARWVFVIIAAAFALVALPAACAGRDAGAPAPARAGAHLPWRVLLPVWVVMMLVYSVLSAQWALADVVGRQLQLPPERIGPVLALVSLLGTVGALAASHRRSHELRRPIVGAAAALMGAAALGFFLARDGAGFFVTQLLVSFAYYAVTPFLTSRISALDRDGALLSRSIVITFVAAALGTAVAGTALTQLGGLGCGLALGACALLAIPFTGRAFGSTRHEANRTDDPRPGGWQDSQGPEHSMAKLAATQELPPMPPRPAARRPPAPEIPAVHVGNLRFEQAELPRSQADGGQRLGYLAAYRGDSDELLWRVRVYEIAYKPGLEGDVQDVFFAAMSVSPDGHQIFVDNTRGARFAVDIDGDHAVHVRP